MVMLPGWDFQSLLAPCPCVLGTPPELMSDHRTSSLCWVPAHVWLGTPPELMSDHSLTFAMLVQLPSRLGIERWLTAAGVNACQDPECPKAGLEPL